MSEVRDYGLDGANPAQLNTPPSPIDLEAQSPQSPVQPQETDNKNPISPIVSHVSQTISSQFVSHLELRDIMHE